MHDTYSIYITLPPKHTTKHFHCKHLHVLRSYYCNPTKPMNGYSLLTDSHWQTTDITVSHFSILTYVLYSCSSFLGILYQHLYTYSILPFGSLLSIIPIYQHSGILHQYTQSGILGHTTKDWYSFRRNLCENFTKKYFLGFVY